MGQPRKEFYYKFFGDTLFKCIWTNINTLNYAWSLLISVIKYTILAYPDNTFTMELDFDIKEFKLPYTIYR